MEDAFVHIAEKSQTPTIILCDRGALDTKLFVREADFVNLRCALGYEDENKLLERYDAVVHLVTTAIGAEIHYSGTDGNAARRESVQQARSQDHGIRQAWMKHPNFLLISNKPEGSTFEDKLKRTTEAVCAQVGIQMSNDVKRQWIVDLQDDFTLQVAETAIRFQIETNFISSTDTDDVCVRRTSLVELTEGTGTGTGTGTGEKGGEEVLWPKWQQNWQVGATYALHHRTCITDQSSRPVQRSDRRLTKKEWKVLRESGSTEIESSAHGTLEKDTTIRMKRTCFVHDETFWKLDEIVGPHGERRGVSLLTLEGTKDMDSAVIPPFTTTFREVSLLSLRDLKETGLLESKPSTQQKTTSRTGRVLSNITKTPIVTLRHPNHSALVPQILKAGSVGQLLQMYQLNWDGMGWYTAVVLINKIRKHATKTNRPSFLDTKDPRWLGLLGVMEEAMDQKVVDSKARMGYDNDDLTSVKSSLEVLDMDAHPLYFKLCQKIQEETEEEDDPGESGHDFQGGSIGF